MAKKTNKAMTEDQFLAAIKDLSSKTHTVRRNNRIGQIHQNKKCYSRKNRRENKRVDQ